MNEEKESTGTFTIACLIVVLPGGNMEEHPGFF